MVTAPQQSMGPPPVVFGTDVTLPTPPVDKEGKPMASAIGNDAARQKSFSLFQDMWNRAGNPPPKLDDFQGDMKAYKAAEIAYNNNPLAEERARIEKKYKDNPAGQSKESLDKIYKSDVQDLANAYMNGIDRGVQDPSLNAKREGALWQMIGGNVFGGIKTLLMTIPWVGDQLAAGGKMLMSWVQSMFDKDVKAIDFTQAMEQIRLEKSFAGAAAALGAQGNSNMFGLMVDAGKGAFAQADFKPAQAVPTIELDASFDDATVNKISDESVKKQINDLRQQGKLKDNLANEEALRVLDGVAPNVITGKQGGSWAANK